MAFFYSNYLLLHWQLLVMVIFGFFGTVSFFTVEWEAAAIVRTESDTTEATYQQICISKQWLEPISRTGFWYPMPMAPIRVLEPLRFPL